jgi:hypothetical protein
MKIKYLEGEVKYSPASKYLCEWLGRPELCRNKRTTGKICAPKLAF